MIRIDKVPVLPPFMNYQEHLLIVWIAKVILRMLERLLSFCFQSIIFLSFYIFNIQITINDRFYLYVKNHCRGFDRPDVD